MRPLIFFAATFVFLIGGTFVGRYAGNRVRVPSAEAAEFSRKTVPFAPNGAIALGNYSLEQGEGVALHRLVAGINAHPADIVTIEWFEIYHGHRRQRRAQYIPSAHVLTCQTKGDFYSYAPVTPEGMRIALAREDSAPFANAHLYSLSTLTAP